MMILGDERQRLINQIKFSKSLQKLTNGEHVHDELEFRCLPLSYSLEPEDFSPSGLEVIPLWESEISITGFYMDSDEKPVFIHFYIEDSAEYKVLGSQVSDLVDFIINEYVDYDLEDEVRKILLY